MADSRSRRRPVLLVVIGLGLVVVGVQFSHVAGLAEFTYSVEATTQAAATDAARASGDGNAVVSQFTELSAAAQDAFLRAFEAADNRATIRGWEHRVTELDHTGDTPARPGDGLYYVAYQGGYYEFTARHPMGAAGLSVLFGYALAVGGTALGTYGGLRRQSSSRPVLALLGGVVAFLGAYGVTGWWGLTEFPALLAVGSLCAFPPAAGAWYLSGALRT